MGSVLVLSVIYYVFIKDAPPWREGLQNLMHPIRDSCIDLPNDMVPHPHEVPLSCKDLLEAIYTLPDLLTCEDLVALRLTHEELAAIRCFDEPIRLRRSAWQQPECYETDGKRIIWLCEEIKRANRENEN